MNDQGNCAGPDQEGPLKKAEPEDKWEHRHLGMRCASCMWFVRKSSPGPELQEKGRCRRHAPTMTGYPVVFFQDWCGDHKLA